MAESNPRYVTREAAIGLIASAVQDTLGGEWKRWNGGEGIAVVALDRLADAGYLVVRAELVAAAQEANEAMRLFNRGGMSWPEYDAVFARLESFLAPYRPGGER